MDFKRNSKCWYNEVCNLQSCNSCLRYEEMSYLMDSSGIPEARQLPTELIPDSKDYESFIQLKEIKNNIVRFVNGGNNLFICSNNCGNGKTSWALKLMLRYFDQIWSGNGFRVRGLFVHVPTLLFQLKNFEKPLSTEYKHNLIETDLVIFDDISESNISSYDYSNLLTIIDGRLLYNKSCIFTSNQTQKKDLEDILGVRLASRIYNESMIIELVGKDRRNGKSTDNF